MLQLESANTQVGAQAESKEQAIRMVAGLLVRSGFIEPGYDDSMLAREQVANTYLGKGVAIPHGLPKDRGMIRRTGIAVLQVPGGVVWQAGEMATIIVGIAARSDEHLDILSNLTGLLYDDEMVARLAVTSDSEEIVAALSAPRAEAPLRSGEAGDFGRSVSATVAGAHGLHARPATAFVEIAKGFAADVSVRHGARRANGKSLAALLSLGVKKNGEVMISAQGPDAEAALAALKLAIEEVEEEEIVVAGPAHGWSPRSVASTVPGLAASPGLAIGPVRLLRHSKMIVERSAKDPAREHERLREAIATARAELHDLYLDVKEKSGKAGAAIFLAHAEFLADPDLIAPAEKRIAEGESAGWAWQQAIEAAVESLQTVDDPLLAARATDLRYVGTRVLRRLAGTLEDKEASHLSQEPVILLAEDLTPSDAAGLDPAHVLGFCTAGGGPTSHAAIIARSLGIPAVVGVGPAAMHQPEGATAVLDGDNGMLYIDPSEEDIRAAREAQSSLADLRDAEHRTRYEPAVTTDGVRIEVVANTGLAKEAAHAVEAGGEGIGLMRSEFLFLERETPPSEEEQYEAYRLAVDALHGLPLIVRTLDIGGDKAVPYLDMPAEENPFLGVRGIRLCLAYPELFRTQLRAIFRAAAHGPVKIMYPMIATVADLRDAQAITESVRQELGAERLETGIMIEVPSAVIMAPELAAHADFFSIGTNDLTQYVLAMDRGHPQLARQADGLHPAVLRMIDQTVRATAGRNTWVGVCGGVAGDPLGAVILIGLGVTELSVSIPSIAAIKARVRGISMKDAQSLARRALACDSAEAVRGLVKGRARAGS